MLPDDWWMGVRAGLRLVTCTALTAIDGVEHAFGTRLDEYGREFNLASGQSAGEVIRQRRIQFGLAAGLGDQPMWSLHQTHETAVLRCAELSQGVEATGDGLVSLRGDRPRRALSVMTADCVPLVLAENNGQAVAAIHAGWRGTAGGIAAEAVRTLSQLGCRPDGLIAALGPAIGGCCYTVDPDLAATVARAAGVEESEIAVPRVDGKVRLDLRRANRLQLLRAGVPESSIFIAPWCTRCSPGLFFSYRRDGSRAGRMLTGVGWAP